MVITYYIGGEPHYLLPNGGRAHINAVATCGKRKIKRTRRQGG